ncbi:MAG: hypothetical protein ACXADF_17120 [Candidatus Thorarchaeota archaeon]|jgi:hypothetical protein
MHIDLNPKGIIEKLAIVAILALAAHAYSLYNDVCELVAMKDDLKAVQQYLLEQKDPS